MSVDEIINSIEAIGEQLYFEVKAYDEGTQLSEQEIKERRNKCIDRAVGLCKEYENVLDKQSIRKYLIAGLNKAARENNNGKEFILE